MRNLIAFSLLTILLIACSAQMPIEVSGFPLEKGTTWDYSYEAYDTSPIDPQQIIKATYQFTESIVETQNVSQNFVAHVKRERKLINADTGWLQDFTGQQNEFWYVRNGQKLFQSNLPLDPGNIKTNELILDYEFPLSLKSSWCLLPDSRNSTTLQDNAGCDFVGKRAVTDRGRYETPAGRFENCYDLVDYYNGGNIFQKLCDGVGIVFMKFDHAGSRFGFEQTLIKFSKGTP
jgi:hypothetical protein